PMQCNVSIAPLISNWTLVPSQWRDGHCGPVVCPKISWRNTISGKRQLGALRSICRTISYQTLILHSYRRGVRRGIGWPGVIKGRDENLCVLQVGRGCCCGGDAALRLCRNIFLHFSVCPLVAVSWHGMSLFRECLMEHQRGFTQPHS